MCPPSVCGSNFVKSRRDIKVPQFWVHFTDGLKQLKSPYFLCAARRSKITAAMRAEKLELKRRVSLALKTRSTRAGALV